MGLLYLQTFTIFPGVILKYKLEGISFSWTLVFYLLSFNVGDTLGKEIAGKRNLYNLTIVIFLFMLRFINIAIFLYLAKENYKIESLSFLHNNYSALINVFIFAVLQGFCTTSFFIMGPEKVEDI